MLPLDSVEEEGRERADCCEGLRDQLSWLGLDEGIQTRIGLLLMRK